MLECSVLSISRSHWCDGMIQWKVVRWCNHVKWRVKVYAGGAAHSANSAKFYLERKKRREWRWMDVWRDCFKNACRVLRKARMQNRARSAQSLSSLASGNTVPWQSMHVWYALPDWRRNTISLSEPRGTKRRIFHTEQNRSEIRSDGYQRAWSFLRSGRMEMWRLL